MKKHVVWFAALAMTAMAAAPAQAQWQFGAQASYGTDSEIGVGARAEMKLDNKLSQQGPLSQARFVGSFDYYLDAVDCPTGASCSYWEINPGLVVPLKSSSMKPYVGAGLNYAHASFSGGGFSTSTSDTGINLIGGVNMMAGSLPAFVEGRFALGGSEQLALSFGFLFGGAK